MGPLLKGICKATILMVLIAVVALICRVVYGYMVDSSLLTLREVVIEGCRKISEREILSLTQLDRRPNILSVELDELRSKLETNPWIARAEIRRIFPDSISIKVIERRPNAIILLERLYYIDAQGAIFARVPEDQDIDYPILTGLHREDFKADPDQARALLSKALTLLTVMEDGEILSKKDISEIHMDKAFGISIYTKEGAIEIKLGLDHYGLKWKRLERVWRHLRETSLNPLSIDCNYEKRIIVKVREATA